MFVPEAREMIRDILELFSRASQIPLELYEIDEDGKVAAEPIRARETQFPEHCRTVWTLLGGEAKAHCNLDMCRRAQEAVDDRRNTTYMCHAGLDNQTQLIESDGKPIAVIQYGAFRLVDAERESEVERRERHRRAMRELGATEAEAARIGYLLFADTVHRTVGEWKILDEALFPLLSALIGRYVMKVAVEQNTRARAYHDLQLRLAAAMAMAENLAEDLADGSAKDVQQEVGHIVGAISAATNVMHSLTHGQYLPKTYRYRTHHVRSFIDNALALCRPEAKKKGIELRLDLQPYDGHIAIEASWRHLEQAFNNLIQNAVKYSYRSSMSAATHRYVLIRGRVVNDGYEVSISNFGVGIEPEEYTSIFDEWYRGRLTDDEYRTGSGLGLPLTKRVIEGHGGTIRVESEPASDTFVTGQRPYHTRFTVWLPLTQRRTAMPRTTRKGRQS